MDGSARTPAAAVRARLPEVRRLVLYLGAAGVGTVLDLATALGLLRAGAPVVVAVGAGWCANVAAGYLLNRFVVFPDGTATAVSSAWRYACVVAFNALVGIGAVSLAVALGTPYLLARVVSSVFLVVANLLLSRRWVFRVPRPATSPASGD